MIPKEIPNASTNDFETCKNCGQCLSVNKWSFSEPQNRLHPSKPQQTVQNLPGKLAPVLDKQ